MRKTPSSFGAKNALTLALSVAVGTAAHAGIPAQWIGEPGGNWVGDYLWSTGVAPNNGTPPETTYDVMIGAPDTFNLVTLDYDVTIDSLRLQGPQTAFQHTAGTLTITGIFDIGDAIYKFFRTATLRGGTLCATGGGTLQVYQNGPYYSTLDGVTLASSMITLGDTAVRNGLTFLGPTIRFPSGTSFRFLDSTPLTGNCVVYGADAFTNAVIGPGITISDQFYPPGNKVPILDGCINHGTIEVANPQSGMSIGGNWSNHGTIRVSAGTLYLGGTFTTSGIGSIVRTGGSVCLTGYLDNTNAMLSVTKDTGPWAIGGTTTLHGGTVTGDGNVPLIMCPGSTCKADGVTLSTQLQVGRSGSLVLDKGNLILRNGTVLGPRRRCDGMGQQGRRHDGLIH